MFGARYYGSSLGRFMTPDWAAKPTAVPYAKFGNPQTLNLYSYVENNPTTVGDPNGHGDATGGYCDANRCYSSPADTRNGTTLKEAALQGVGMGSLAAGFLFAPELGTAALVRFAPLLTAAGSALQSARDEASNAIEGVRSFDLSTVTSSRVSGALNSLSDHVTDMDIKGAIREANGLLQGNHATGELQDAVNSLSNLKSSLQGAMQNPNLADDARTGFTQAVQAINNFVQVAQPVINQARQVQQAAQQAAPSN
jgi:RHS repeat-associated protein